MTIPIYGNARSEPTTLKANRRRWHREGIHAVVDGPLLEAKRTGVRPGACRHHPLSAALSPCLRTQGDPVRSRADASHAGSVEDEWSAGSVRRRIRATARPERAPGHPATTLRDAGRLR